MAGTKLFYLAEIPTFRFVTSVFHAVPRYHTLPPNRGNLYI